MYVMKLNFIARQILWFIGVPLTFLQVKSILDLSIILPPPTAEIVILTGTSILINYFILTMYKKEL